MLKSIATLASIVAVTTAYAEEVRVMSGGIEHVYGRGGQVLDSPELRAKNERAERQMRSLDQRRNVTVQTSRRQAPRSWWNDAPQQPPKSWWSDPQHQNPPKSVYSDR
jgi:hypothetical protein